MMGRLGLTARLLTIALPWWRCKVFCNMLEKTKKKKENDMGALIMFGFVSLIAIVGGIYFYLEDKKDVHAR